MCVCICEWGLSTWGEGLTQARDNRLPRFSRRLALTCACQTKCGKLLSIDLRVSPKLVVPILGGVLIVLGCIRITDKLSLR